MYVILGYDGVNQKGLHKLSARATSMSLKSRLILKEITRSKYKNILFLNISSAFLLYKINLKKDVLSNLIILTK